LYTAATDGVQKAFDADMTDRNKKGTSLVFTMPARHNLHPEQNYCGVLYDKVIQVCHSGLGSDVGLAAVRMNIFCLTKDPPAKLIVIPTTSISKSACQNLVRLYPEPKKQDYDRNSSL
jgi:hypothetical protein